MAEPVSAWGIDIGQAGLKAMKLRVSDDGERVIAAAFDYIPHPKILSQPDAIPEELIREAMKTFLDRNKIEDDLIAISVPGQSSLAKFIKLPPVEANKVAEIVKYEARQQIPFDLNDVIWDYQPLGGGIEESGFMLEAEVGLFAMKRELVFDALKPFTNNGKEVEIVQIAPLALYNYLSYDVMGFRKTAETPEPLAAEDYYVILDMGADNTTLLVSNGRNIWIRNVPIGGNHFTRALTREMKLTFAKAEHLKCNATKAPDPKAVFQAMRPVFNDYVSEIQRSIGFFGSGWGAGFGTGFIIQFDPGGFILGVLLSGQQPYLVPLQPPINGCCLIIGQLVPSKFILELMPSGQQPNLVLVQLGPVPVTLEVVVTVVVEVLTITE